jgi:hypothetical protein
MPCAVLQADPPTGIQRVVAYTSPVDGSQQEYGIYLPISPPPSPAGYPAILHAHGYGWSVDGNFSPWQKAWADGHGFILVNANVRGPVFGDGVGDIATQELVADIIARFGVDRARVCYTGGSMGGTTALRHGVRHPELFAAVYGVDGWTDFREWHWHWYARADMRDSIEEFRRPLLEAASPFYSASRAMWGATGAIVDGRDNVVFPDNGLRLEGALTLLAGSGPPVYDHALTLVRDKGHCGGYDLNIIYNYFASRVAYPQPGSFRIETTLLAHGTLYWGEMQALHHPGERSVLDCASGDDAVWVTTTNLDAFTLHLAARPVSRALSGKGDGGEAANEADATAVHAVSPSLPGRGAGGRAVQEGAGGRAVPGGQAGGRAVVVIDGYPLSVASDASATFEAIRNDADAIVGWRIAELPAFHKTPRLEGPIGQVVTQPFMVVYGTAGDPAAADRHRAEAQAFADGWNNFYVHGPGVKAIPEDQASPADLADKNLILYGSLETSTLLRRAQEQQPLPVEVHEGRIVVRDSMTGDRSYDGPQFGCFSAYPNPLTNGRTYLLVCTGRWATTPDGGARQGLEYDIETIPWAYSDYVIFNTDQEQLPHVLNVNNKPPVTCYEAAYFVESGYFDNAWQPARLLEIERVARTAPANVKLIHVSGCVVTTDASAVPPRLSAWVCVTDAGGNPVAKVRVTGRFAGPTPLAVSGVTDDDGFCTLDSPPGATSFRVLNLAATAATYDFRADTLAGSSFADNAAGLAIRPTCLRPTVTREDALSVEADVCNVTSTPVIAQCALSVPDGDASVTPARQAASLGPGETRRIAFRWRTGDAPLGEVRLVLQAQVSGLPAAQCTVQAQVLPRPRARVLDCSVVDGSGGDGPKITATLFSETGSPEDVTVVVAIPEAQVVLPPRDVTISASGGVTATFELGKGMKALPRGAYHAVASMPDCPGAGTSGEFAVR